MGVVRVRCRDDVGDVRGTKLGASSGDQEKLLKRGSQWAAKMGVIRWLKLGNERVRARGKEEAGGCPSFLGPSLLEMLGSLFPYNIPHIKKGWV